MDAAEAQPMVHAAHCLYLFECHRNDINCDLRYCDLNLIPAQLRTTLSNVSMFLDSKFKHADNILILLHLIISAKI